MVTERGTFRSRPVSSYRSRDCRCCPELLIPGKRDSSSLRYETNPHRNSKQPICSLKYRIDIAFWGVSSEIETLPAAKFVVLSERVIDGTGLLPNPGYQGHVLLDANWCIDVVESTPEIIRIEYEKNDREKNHQ